MKYLFSALMIVGLMSCNAQQQQGEDNKFADVNKQQAKEMMANTEGLQIIDVRTDGEVAQGMIDGAIQIDISDPDFAKKLESLDKEKPVLVYCKSGGRSKSAQGVMQEQGFTEVYNLLGGYSNW